MPFYNGGPIKLGLIGPPYYETPPARAAVNIATTFFTDFLTDENPLREGGRWLEGLADGLDWNNVRSSGGNALPTHVNTVSPPFDDNIACIDPSFITFGDNQYAQATVFKSGGHLGNCEIEILVRWAISAHTARGYEIYWNTTAADAQLVRWNGALNDFVPLTSGSGGGGIVDGDLIRVEVVGTVITVKKNGTSVLTYDTVSDGTKWSSGQPGIGLNPFTPNGDTTTAGWKDFACGNL
jgi:hypothetical protein